MFDRLRNLTITAKLIISFSLIIAMFTGSHVYSSLSYWQANRLLFYRIDFVFARVEYLLELRQGFAEIRRLQDNSFLCPDWIQEADLPTRHRYEAEIVNTHWRLHRWGILYINSVENDPLFGAGAIAIRVQAMRELIDNLNNVHDLFRENFFTGGTGSNYKGNMQDYILAVEAGLQRLSRFADIAVEGTSYYVNNTLENIRNFTMAIILLAIAVAIVLAYLIINGISKKAIEKDLKILNAMPFAIDVWDDSYTPIDCNRKSLELFGLPSKEEYFRRFYELSPETQPCGGSSKEKAQFYMKQAMKEGFASFEFMHKTTAGEPLPTAIILVRIQHRNRFLLVSYTSDLRQIKAAMEKERKAHELTQAILDSAPFAIGLWDDNYNLLNISKHAREMLGISEQEMLARPLYDFSPKYQPCGMPAREKAIQCLNKAYTEGRTQFEWMHITSSGELLPTEVIALRFKRNDKYTLVTYTIDLRGMKNALAKIREADERVMLMLDATPLSCFLAKRVTKENGALDVQAIDCNRAALALFGFFSKAEALMRFKELFPVSPKGLSVEEIFFDNANIAYKKGYHRFEFIHKHQNGELIPCEITLVRVSYQGEPILACYQGDLREIKAAMTAAKDAEERAALLVEVLPTACHLLDSDFNQIWCNQTSVELFAKGPNKPFVEPRANDENTESCDFDCHACERLGRDTCIARRRITENPCAIFPNYIPNNKEREAEIKQFIADSCNKALAGSRHRFEIDYLTLYGEIIPSEVTIIPIKYRGGNSFAWYIRDMREEKRREIAEEESRAKSRFLARMSHEIRTPMNAVLGITEIQLQKGSHSPETEEAFLRIHSSSNLLLTIINDILDLSKVEAGKMEIIPERYEVANMIVDTVQLNVMRIGSKSIEFKLNVDEHLLSHFIGDELRIKQVMNNILSNAFKYTNEGFVTLSVSMEDARQTGGKIILVLSVQDTGQGMTGDQINSLDTEFARFNLRNNRIIEGSGLGMAIAYQLVNMMEGVIKVESEKGRGSTFTVRIPQKPGSNSAIGKETAENLENFEVTQKSLKKMAKLTYTPMPYGRILVVDDVESNLYVIKGLLMPYKIAVETVTNGHDAIEKVKNGGVYDIIFMDHMMPGMDGIEATRIIRELGYGHPIVVLTANALKNAPEMFLNSGFSGFIPKPININQFNSYLMRFIHDKQPPEVLKAAEMQYTGENINNVFGGLRESFLLDAQKALDILEPFVLGQELDKEGLKSFAIQTHAMKSALYNIGREELSETALTLENACRTADVEAVRAFAPGFLESLKETIKELSPDDTDDGDVEDEETDFLKAQLQIITQACDKFDLEAADTALEKLRQIQYSVKTKKLIKAISANLLFGDFEEAATLANESAAAIQLKQES